MFRKSIRATAVCLAYPVAFLNAAQSQERTAVTVFDNVRIFDGKKRSLSAPSDVLMPGLSDVHWHAMMVKCVVCASNHSAGSIRYVQSCVLLSVLNRKPGWLDRRKGRSI